MINNLNSIQTFTKAQNTYFALEKQGSENVYLPSKEPIQNTKGANFNQILNNAQAGQQVKYANYYNMFIVSQRLQKSEILKNYNHEIAIKQYA